MSYEEVYSIPIDELRLIIEARREHDRNLVEQLGALMRWQVAMTIRGYHNPKSISQNDWILFEKEKDKGLTGEKIREHIEKMKRKEAEENHKKDG